MRLVKTKLGELKTSREQLTTTMKQARLKHSTRITKPVAKNISEKKKTDRLVYFDLISRKICTKAGPVGE